MEYFRKKYSEVELIKKDNWADIYMAINNATQEKVQLKILKSQSDNTKYINSITYEIEQLQNLKNKNLIGINGIYNFIENNIIYYYVETEYFKGKTLSEKMILTGHTCKESLEIIKQVAEGLNEFHYRGLNYETLSGQNIFINSDGVVKIDVLSYIQQKYDEEYDNYDEFEDGIDKDIYAVGVILYQLITRDQNFKLKKLKKNIEDEEVYSILYSLTSKKIKYRYEGLNEFLLDINEYLEKLSYKANQDLEYIYEDDFEEYEHKSNKFVLIKRLSACLAVVLVVAGGIKVVGLVKKDDNKLETQTQTQTEIIAEEESIDKEVLKEEPKEDQLDEQKVESTDTSTNDYNLNSDTEDDTDKIVQAPSSSNTNNNSSNNDNNSNNTNSGNTNNNDANNNNTNNGNSNNTNTNSDNNNNSNNNTDNSNNNDNNSDNTDSDKNNNDVNQPSNEDKPSDSGNNGSEDANTGTDDKGQISEQSQSME